MTFRRLLFALLTVLMALALASDVAHAKPRKSRRGSRVTKRAIEPAVPQVDLSNTVEVKKLKNGVVLWGLRRPGPMGTVALVVRAGTWNEDPGKPSASLAAARWVLEPSTHDYLARFGVALDFEMHAGGPAFVLRGPADRLPAALGQLTRSLMKPAPERMARSRVRAVLEPRRYDVARSLPDLARGMCWVGGSFELPTYGRAEDALGMLDSAGQVSFWNSWYQPRHMTVVAVGPGGASSYASVMNALRGRGREREVQSPGQPALPIHQVQHGLPSLTLAGVVIPGTQNAGSALLMRARLAELLQAEMAKGTLAGPAVADVAWTAGHCVVYAVVMHPGEANEQELTEAQARQLKQLEDLLSAATELDDAALNELRKREGARLFRSMATPEGVLSVLVPWASFTDTPPDLRKAVLSTPTPALRAQWAETRGVRSHFSLRRLSDQRKR